MEPLACVPLDGDQSARNGADTVNAAIAASGLNPAKCQQGMSDGADAATQETERVLKEQHRRAVEAAKQPRVQPAPPQQQQQQPQQDADAQEGPRLRRPPQPERALGEPPRTSTGESCCIHANALVERAFLDEAFPLLIDATRMMWEIFRARTTGSSSTATSGGWSRTRRCHPTCSTLRLPGCVRGPLGPSE